MGKQDESTSNKLTRAQHSEPGYVYLIMFPTAGAIRKTFVKIGISRDPIRRRKEIERKTNMFCVLMAMIPVEDMADSEIWLLESFEHCRAQGTKEYFAFCTDDILQFFLMAMGLSQDTYESRGLYETKGLY